LLKVGEMAAMADSAQNQSAISVDQVTSAARQLIRTNRENHSRQRAG